MKTQGEIIKDAMESRGVNQRQLAIGIGKTPQYIADLVHGRRQTLRPETVESIADVLGIHADDLYVAAGVAPPDLVALMQRFPGLSQMLRAVALGHQKQDTRQLLQAK